MIDEHRIDSLAAPSIHKRAVAGSAAAPSRAAAAGGALTGRQRGVSRALCGPQRLTAHARATACCAAAPPRGCCSQRRSDGPLLAEPRRPEGAARAGPRPAGASAPRERCPPRPPAPGASVAAAPPPPPRARPSAATAAAAAEQVRAWRRWPTRPRSCRWHHLPVETGAGRCAASARQGSSSTSR